MPRTRNPPSATGFPSVPQAAGRTPSTDRHSSCPSAAQCPRVEASATSTAARTPQSESTSPIRRRPRQVTSDGIGFSKSACNAFSSFSRPTNITTPPHCSVLSQNTPRFGNDYFGTKFLFGNTVPNRRVGTDSPPPPMRSPSPAAARGTFHLPPAADTPRHQRQTRLIRRDSRSNAALSIRIRIADYP